jgi:hypothetical protein
VIGSGDEGQASTNDSPEYSPAESVDMTDAQSIASMNSRSEMFTAELTIDAQKLDFAFQPAEDDQALGSPDMSIDIDEGNTVELENDITSLLAAAGVRESLKGIVVIDKHQVAGRETTRVSPAQEKPSCEGNDEGSDNSHSRSVSSSRSISSRSFTLCPPNKLRFSDDGDVLSQDVVSQEPSPNDCGELDRSIAPEPPEEQFEPPSMTFDELVKASGIHPQDLGPCLQSKDEDTLVRFGEYANGVDTIAFERWNQFLQAVCSEVEKRTEIDGSASSRFSTVVEDNPHLLSHLHRMVEPTDNGNFNEDLHRLVQAGKHAIESEWNTWLLTVLESFESAIAEVSRNLSGEMMTLDEASAKCTDFQETFSLMSSRRVQRARRKSSRRRKVSNAFASLICTEFFPSHRALRCYDASLSFHVSKMKSEPYKLKSPNPTHRCNQRETRRCQRKTSFERCKTRISSQKSTALFAWQQSRSRRDTYHSRVCIHGVLRALVNRRCHLVQLVAVQVHQTLCHTTWGSQTRFSHWLSNHRMWRGRRNQPPASTNRFQLFLIHPSRELRIERIGAFWIVPL